ncbi:MAG: undecaprenyl-phosphate galactose phosphotransferase WbaP [Victivallaceae bacterium]|nr:undecaprenyl-phosphate galactose phosphotransferase WbaP [Victivallaceae bacterium]
MLILTDFLAFYALGLVLSALYQSSCSKHEHIISSNLWCFALILICVNALSRIYHGNIFFPGIALNPVEEFRRSFLIITLSCSLLFAYSLLVEPGTILLSFIFIYYASTLLVVPLGRFFARACMQRFNIFKIDVLIVGSNRASRQLAQNLRDTCFLHGLNPLGFVGNDADANKCATDSLPFLGGLECVKKLAQERKIDYLIICLSNDVLAGKINDWTLYFKHIMLVPDLDLYFSSNLYPGEINGVLGIEIKNQLLLPSARYLKAVLEFIFAIALLLATWPLFLILATMVKLSSPGPVFYKTRRLGLGGREINMYKFRTMYVYSETHFEEILLSDPVAAKEWEENFKLENDPRITPVGNFLRKTSLDELPQFLNVLSGDMAVVGPRPIVQSEVKLYGDSYEIRKRVKPGITGLWQVSGRNNTSYARRVFWDTYYIRNWSPWLDYYIFFKTVWEVLLCRGAK